jgi:GNAT superfamily N-acetyltransferase
MIDIVPFAGKYQKAVEELVLPIQKIEFGVPVTVEGQPDLADVAGFFQHGCGNFWLALDQERVIGTIGVVDVANGQLALKKMFVSREFRGSDKGIGQALLDTALAWSRKNGIKQIFLGSTTPMVAAHRFYEKNGFVPVLKSELPSSFPLVEVDDKFYRYDL